MSPTEFCPAIACATTIARIEAAIDAIEHLKTDLSVVQSTATQDQIELIADQLIADADEARTRLSEIDAHTSLGAIAQLLCAIRDIRVADDYERLRAKQLEARALLFLDSNNLLEAAFCAQLSQTRFGAGAGYDANRSISASEIS